MKGIEGLPLKYLILILVGVIVIGVALTMVGNFSSSVIGGSEDLTGTLNETLGYKNQQICESIGCTWNTTSTACDCPE